MTETTSETTMRGLHQKILILESLVGLLINNNANREGLIDVVGELEKNYLQNQDTLPAAETLSSVLDFVKRADAT